MWMQPYLDEGDGIHQVSYRNHVTGETRDGPGIAHRRGGYFRTRSLKVACQTCNNGWMSVLQQSTKPVLLPLIEGQRAVLTREQQRIMATWLTMWSMVYENCQPETIAIPQTERETFWQTRQPFPHWKMWTAPYSGPFCGYHVGLGLADIGWQSRTQEMAAHCNTHFSMTGFGAVCFLAVSTTAERRFKLSEPNVNVLIRKAGFTRIWPVRQQTVSIRERAKRPLSVAALWAFGHAIEGAFS